jgi:uncharacterized protein YeaO (DUF488 family)
MSRRSPRPAVKRVYEPAEVSDGTRVFVGRIWPRGLTKEHASVEVWLKDIARAPAPGPGLAMTRIVGASFTSDSSRSSAPITAQSST